MNIKDGSSSGFNRTHLPMFYTIKLKDTLLSIKSNESHIFVSMPSFKELQLKIICIVSLGLLKLSRILAFSIGVI
jgi:hypothetical protein